MVVIATAMRLQSRIDADLARTTLGTPNSSMWVLEEGVVEQRLGQSRGSVLASGRPADYNTTIRNHTPSAGNPQ